MFETTITYVFFEIYFYFSNVQPDQVQLEEAQKQGKYDSILIPMPYNKVKMTLTTFTV